MAHPKFRFDFNWKLTLFTLLFIPVLCRLGFWQLSRAEEKRSLLEAQATQQAMPTTRYTAKQTFEDFQRVVISGKFDSQRYWLLEARQFDGKLGYEVVMPLLFDSGVILVNRGWVPAKKYRDQDPEVATPSGQLTLTGQLVMPSNSPLIDHSGDKLDRWPQRILEIDTTILSRQYRSALEKPVLQIDPDDPAAFAVRWQSINMLPQRHIGYAVQWFSLAIALATLWIFASSNLASQVKKRLD